MTEKEIKEKARPFIEEFGLDELDTDAFVQGALWAQSNTRLQFNEIVSQAFSKTQLEMIIMGKSSYIELVELNTVLAKREDALRERIGEDREAILALESLLLNLEKKRKLIEAERHQAWVRYAEAYKEWAIKYSGKFDTMEAGMSEPNRPDYERANND